MKALISFSLMILAVSAYRIDPLEDEKVEFVKISNNAKHVKAVNPMDDALWREYKLQFGKFYKTKEEESKRYLIWKQHLENVQTHNANPIHSYKKGLNHFHDLVS